MWDLGAGGHIDVLGARGHLGKLQPSGPCLFPLLPHTLAFTAHLIEVRKGLHMARALVHWEPCNGLPKGHLH